MRFRTKDELGNDWSPYSYNKGDKSNSAPNVVKIERPFTNFDFALMTRAEVTFLWKLANGKNPYPKSALKQYPPPGGIRGSVEFQREQRKKYKHSDENWEFVQLFRPEILQNALNWAPLDEELIYKGSIFAQEKEYSNFYQGQLPLGKEERYGGQRPDQFILNSYRFERKGPFSTPPQDQWDGDKLQENLIVGDLDKFITAGVDPNLKSDHSFYGRIIPPRELVYYIRRKYGISSAPIQTAVEVDKDRRRSEFKPYDNQFLFDQKYLIGTNTREWIATRFKNKIFKERRTQTPSARLTPNIAMIMGGRTLSEQSFITRSIQYQLFTKQNQGKAVTDLSKQIEGEFGWYLNELYNSINTQQLFAHYRAIFMLDELNNWGRVVVDGLKSGTIIAVPARIAKKGEESKSSSADEHRQKEDKMTPTALALKQPQYNQNNSFVTQFISNIPEKVDKNKIPDYKYHVRSWNVTGGANGPLFNEPEYSADFNKGDCDITSKYFMRNLIRPKVADILNPLNNEQYYTEFSDKDTFASDLTLVELESRMLKELPFLMKSLSNPDYNRLKNLSINLDGTGKKIVNLTNEIELKKAMNDFAKQYSLSYKVYELKKDLLPHIYATVGGLAFVHYVGESLKSGEGAVSAIAQLIGPELFAKSSKISKALGKLAHGIHAFEKFSEPVLVGFKVVSAIANISLYNDTASKVALVKELAIGGLMLENVYLKLPIARSIFPFFSTAGAGLVWFGILLAVSWWVDEITANIRQNYKQEKFRNLLEEAHKNGYIEGVYIETEGELRISKKEIKNIILSSISTPEKIGNDVSYDDSFIMSNKELMGPKGNRIFWDRISKNPFECKTLLDIAGKPTVIPGQITGRYNPLLNMAPNQKDYGVFADYKEYNIDAANGKQNIAIPGSSTASSTDKFHPFINAFISAQLKIKPNFKYTRTIIQYDTDLRDYLNNIKESTEFEVITRTDPAKLADRFTTLPLTTVISDKEKVRLIRKKYGLDLINSEAGNNCCNAKAPINSKTVSNPQNFPSDNIRLDSQKQFLTGEPNQVKIVGTDGTVKNELRYKVGCEYLVDLADPDVINKLREICSKKKEVPKDDKTSGKKTSQSPSGKTNTPVLSYNSQLNDEVQNMNLVNYLTQIGNSNQQIYREKGGDGATAGTNDQLPSLMGSPRFGQKASVEVFAQNQSSAPTTAVSQWLVGFATMDIHADLVNFINTLATAFATSNDGNPVPSDKIDLAALGTPVGSSNYFQWTPYGQFPTETESSRTIDRTFGTPNQNLQNPLAPPRTRG